MTTLPHTSATREPFTTLVAELYGDQPTPAPQIPASDHTSDERWHDAVTHVGEQLRAKLRVDILPERQHKALALVLAHAVTLHPDGSASVQSGQQTYTLAPDCPCADAVHRTALCKHALAVELHRRALVLLDGTASAPASSPTAVAAPAGAAPRVSAEAPPAATPPAIEDTRQERLPSANRWDVTEAPASCCLRLRVGELEILYTMRDITDAELTSRVQYLVPWVQDVLDQARERQAHLEALRQQRNAASTAPAVPQLPPPTVSPASVPTDLQALLQQAVQQVLATAANGQTSGTPPPAPPSNGTAPSAPEPDDQQTGFCSLHQVPMAQKQNARGTFYGHWLTAEQRHCNGRRAGRR